MPKKKEKWFYAKNCKPTKGSKKSILNDIDYQLENIFDEGYGLPDGFLKGIKLTDAFCQDYVNGYEEIVQENPGEDNFGDYEADMVEKLVKKHKAIFKSVYEEMAIHNQEGKEKELKQIEKRQAILSKLTSEEIKYLGIKL